MGSRFVRPDTTRLQISGGDWLLVKRRLNAGEQRARFARMYLAGANGALRVNPLQAGLATVTAYLLDWSLTDEQGKPVVIRDLSSDTLTTVLDSLHVDSFTEIREAIEAHDDAMATERAEEQKKMVGASASSAISASPDAAGGATSGSPS